MAKRKLPPRFYRAFPELALFGSDAEARAVLKGFRRHLLRTRRFWLYALLALVLGCGIGPGVRFVLLSQLSLPIALQTLIIAGSAAAVAMVAMNRVWHRPLQAYLRQQLLDRGVAVCLSCGYDLRASKERCPECGSAMQRSGALGTMADGHDEPAHT